MTIPAEMNVELIVIFGMATTTAERSKQDVNPQTTSCFYSSACPEYSPGGAQGTKMRPSRSKAIGYGTMVISAAGRRRFLSPVSREGRP